MLSENTILKAIHNGVSVHLKSRFTANAKWKYNFESNSQHTKTKPTTPEDCEC